MIYHPQTLLANGSELELVDVLFDDVTIDRVVKVDNNNTDRRENIWRSNNEWNILI